MTKQTLEEFRTSAGSLLSGGVFTTIGIPGEFYTEASGINNNGVVVGFYQDTAGLYVSFPATP